MKKGIIAVLAISTALFATSCGKKGGLSEETKMAMQTFETGWKATETNMTAFGATMSTAFTEMNTMMAADEKMDMSKMKPAAKSSMDSMMAMCGVIKVQMDKMNGDYKTAMDQWTADSQAYTDWKKQAQADKIADEAFKTEITGTWTTKLNGYNDALVNMNEMLTGIQAACKSTCDAIAGMAMPMK